MIPAAASAPSRIPTELYQDIIQHISTPHLAALCTVSSTLRHETERVLYRTVQLTEARRIRSWSITIAGSERLAVMVHSLTLTRVHSANVDWDTIYVQESLRIALRNVINLKYLKIIGRYEHGHSYLHPNIFLGCPFRLRGLSGDLTTNEADGLKFLSEQPDIHSWSVGLPFLFLPLAMTRTIPGVILPHLSELNLDMSQMLAYIPKWPLRGLAICFKHFEAYRPDGMDKLRLFRDTLISLRFNGYHASFDQLEQHILLIAESVPKLKHLKCRTVVCGNSHMVRFFFIADRPLYIESLVSFTIYETFYHI